jgi:hypothetical protein
MNFFFLSKPKTNDIDYVEDIYFTLYNAYGVSYRIVFAHEILPDLRTFETLKEFIRIILFDLKIHSNIIETEDNFEYVFNLPRTYYYEEVDDDLTIFITKFGIENPEITIVEILLFLIGVKLFKDGVVSVTDEIYEDVENSYRPFLVIAAVFFGYGELLISRHTITGGFYDDNDDLALRYSYKVPLELNTMLYAQAFVVSMQKKHFNNMPRNFKKMNSQIKTELKSCLKYIESGKSILFNNLR